MRKLNIFLSVGLLLNSIFLLMNRVEFIPDFFKGLCCGGGIALIFIGAYAQNHDISKLISKKIAFINRVFRKV